jgi:Transposase
MYIDDSTLTRNGKTYRRVLLRNSYRINGEVRHDTLANLSQCSDEEIQAIKLALKHKAQLAELGSLRDAVKSEQGLAVGAGWVLNQLALRLGIPKALGKGQEAKLALWLVFAAVIAQGSRLSAVRLAKQHAVCDILDLKAFNEDHLYGALDWLAERQSVVEEALFTHHYREPGKVPTLYLYDVTSSYFEGEHNELADYGYNRDGKRGKKQIVIGLMTDEHGWPLCVEVFKGNTQDSQTVVAQIDKLVKQFGVKRVAFVGDRGMIKSAQIEHLTKEDFYYITAITKPQVESLIKQGVFQLTLFEDPLVEVEMDALRYILKRNPVRAAEIAATRNSKLKRLKKTVAQQNAYLAEHPHAKPTTALKNAYKKATTLQIQPWVEIKVNQNTLSLEVNQDKLKETARLDGCYVIKSDLPPQIASTQTPP